MPSTPPTPQERIAAIVAELTKLAQARPGVTLDVDVDVDIFIATAYVTLQVTIGGQAYQDSITIFADDFDKFSEPPWVLRRLLYGCYRQHHNT